jgi:hypothetical protein
MLDIEAPCIETSTSEKIERFEPSTEARVSTPVMHTNENDRRIHDESIYVSPEETRDAAKRKATESVAHILDEYLRRIHINDGTLNPDWDEIVNIPLSGHMWVQVAEDLRSVILSESGIRPSCGFSQLVAVTGMKSHPTFGFLAARIETSVSDARMCPLGDVYSSLVESIEERFSRTTIPTEFQGKINRLYSLYEIAVSSRVNLEPSIAIEVNLRARMNRMIRDIKSLTV